MAEAKKKKTTKETPEKEAVKEKPAKKENNNVAVVSIIGKQHVIKEGDVFDVENLSLEPGSKVENLDVLLFSDGENVVIGTPNVTGVRVGCEVVENHKGDKIDVIKFKAKSRYSKKVGYRASLSKIKITSLEKGGTHGS